MTSRRTLRARRAGLATAQVALGAAVLAAAVWGSSQSSLTDRIDGLNLASPAGEGFTPTSTIVALQSTVLTCPGTELLGLDGARDYALPTRASAVAPPAEVHGDIPLATNAPEIRIAPLAAAFDAEPLGTGETSATADTTEPIPYAVLGSGAAAAGLVATQETRADVDEVAGLASIPCQGPAPEAWLIGGGGGAGRAERVILTNPGSNPVTVDITMLGAEGTTRPPDAQGLTVPAQGRTLLLGDALALDESSPAMHIVVEGGEVAAALVETSLDGTQPTGFDLVSPSVPPAPEQVIPGVLVPAEDTGSVVVRLVNPGESEVIATMTALADSGAVPLPDTVARVPAGGTVDVPLAGAPPGIVSLVISADGPIAAAARTVSHGGGIDAMWAVSQHPIADLAGVAVPTLDGLTRSLVLTSRGAAGTVTLTQATDGAGTPEEVTIPADGTVTVPVTGQGVWLSADHDEMYAALVTTNAEGRAAALSSLPMTEPPTTGRRSEVVPLR